MKCSTLFSGVSLFALSSGAVASALLPRAAEAGAAAIAKRAPIDDAYSIVSDLYTQIQTYTGAINATSASLTPESSLADKNAATASVGEQLGSITDAVNAATAQVKALPAASSSAKLMARQSVSADQLAQLLAEILEEVSGALNNIIADLGLTPLLSFLSPLVASLSGLLLSLEVVVNNLLALVQQIVDGLLTGLSIGLAGLTL